MNDPAHDPDFLSSLGWTQTFATSFAETDPTRFLTARVVSQGKGHYRLQVARDQTIEAVVTTKFHRATTNASEFPTVGDWVTFSLGAGSDSALIDRILTRRNLVQRRKVGNHVEMQSIAANVDVIFVVTSANEDFDVPRLGRYLSLAKEAGVRPVLILTKADACPNLDEYRDRLAHEFGAVETIATTKTEHGSYDQLARLLGPGQTGVLLGSSGVGKSTLTNYLTNSESQKTSHVSGTAKGRHTTTARTLLFTRFGGLIIDTPGMQDIVGSATEASATEAFADVEALALQCKFTTCAHGKEKGCAVQDALRSGELSAERWTAYQSRPKTRTIFGPKKRR